MLKKLNLLFIGLLFSNFLHTAEKESFFGMQLAPDVLTTFLAAQHGNVETVKTFIALGGDINITDHDGQSLLYIATIHNQKNVVQALVAMPGINLDMTFAGEEWIDEVGMQCCEFSSALTTAVKLRHIEIVNLLINAGASVYLPLIQAISSGDIEMIELLINTPASAIGRPAFLDQIKEHRSLLEVAIRSGQVAVLKLLLDRYQVKYNGSMKTPLFWHAIHAGNKEIALILLTLKNAPLNCYLRMDFDYIQGALDHGWEDVADRLKLYFALIATQDRRDVVDYLLHKDESLKNVTISGCVPVQWAIKNRNREMIHLLLAKDVDLSVMDGGMTLVDLANKYGLSDIAALIADKLAQKSRWSGTVPASGAEPAVSRRDWLMATNAFASRSELGLD